MLVSAYDSFVADEAFAVPDSTLFSALGFAAALNSCAKREAGGAVILRAEGSCAWASLYGRNINRDAAGAGPDYNESDVGLTLGAQAEVSDGLFLGVAAGWESGALSMPGASAAVTRLQAGIIAKRELGATMLSASFGGGAYSSDVSRTIALPGGGDAYAAAEPDGHFLWTHLRIDHRIDRGDLYIKPVGDLGVTWLDQDAYAEAGAGQYGLLVDALQQTVVTFNPFVEIGREYKNGGSTTQVSVRGGVLALFGDAPSTNATFVGLGNGGAGFAISSDQTDLFADLGLAVDVELSRRLVLKANFDALLADGQQQFTGGLRLELSF